MPLPSLPSGIVWRPAWVPTLCDVVNLRLGGLSGPTDEPFEEPLTALVELKQQGLTRHIGLSTVSAKQLA
jgi:aryl-alcohol dehydrogenase-like predicted oxidoreductase